MDLQNISKFSKALNDIEERFYKSVNFFFATGMNTLETKHSAFFSWLLNPSKPHQINAFILKNFLKKLFEYDSTKNAQYGIAVESNESIINLNSSISCYDSFSKIVDDAYNADAIDVQTEYPTDIPDGKKGKRRIDILIDIPAENHKTVIVIENKVFAALSKDQLEDYHSFITDRDDKYKDYENKIFVFLTPNGDYPHNGTKARIYDKRWCVFDYNEIQQIVSELIKSPRLDNQNKLKYILEDYRAMLDKEILKRTNPERILQDKEVLKECKRLLSDEKEMEVFEVVKYYYENYATYSKVLDYCKKWLKDNIPDLVVYNENKRSFCCCTKAMHDYFIDNGEDRYQNGWRCLCGTSSNEDLVGFFQLYKSDSQEWDELQKKFIDTNKIVASNTQVTVESSIVLSPTKDRDVLFNEIKPVLDKKLEVFKERMESFEKKLLAC